MVSQTDELLLTVRLDYYLIQKSFPHCIERSNENLLTAAKRTTERSESIDKLFDWIKPRMPKSKKNISARYSAQSTLCNPGARDLSEIKASVAILGRVTKVMTA